MNSPCGSKCPTFVGFFKRNVGTVYGYIAGTYRGLGFRVNNWVLGIPALAIVGQVWGKYVMIGSWVLGPSWIRLRYRA